jgi:5-methylcytosine-specific restriction endonuclease McrA
MEYASDTSNRLTSRVLVLNASYEVLNIVRWQRALCLTLTGKAEVLEEMGVTVRSPSLSVPLPSVIRMRYYVRKPHMLVPFSRTNIFLRDRYTCQYCGAKRSMFELTLDHVTPRAHGGESCWENVVTACKECNARKSDRHIDDTELRLVRRPRAPQFIPALQAACREEWRKYIPFQVFALEEIHGNV